MEEAASLADDLASHPAVMTVAGLFASREKRRAFRTLMGYVLFERLGSDAPAA